MQLSDESVQRFIGIYKEKYGVDLPVDEARTMATNLVMVYRLISQPLPEVRPVPKQPARRRWVRSEPAEA